ncbi:MAG: hypothetical protein KatS3mg049_0562 [Caldilinea sp.]|jgi:hypothetical protein|nr:MAG: hypothetical protein KatS3mg049_0562 [Caldilinea sp.]
MSEYGLWPHALDSPLKTVGRPGMRSYELRLRTSGPPCISNNLA